MKLRVSLLGEFLGRKTVVLALLSIALGFILVAMELAMAASIQAFFASIGLASVPLGSLESLVPNPTATQVLAALIIIGTGRGILVWGQTYLSSVATSQFENLNRRRIASWVFATRSARLDVVAQLFADKTVGAGAFVSSATGAVHRLVIAGLLGASLLVLAPKVAVVSFVLLLVLAVPSRMITKRLEADAQAGQQQFDQALSRVVRGIKNSLFLHIYGMVNSERAHTVEHLNHQLERYKSYYFFSGMKVVLPQVFGIWLITAVTFASIHFSQLPAGDLIKFFYLFVRFVQSLSDLANLGSYMSLNRTRTRLLWEWWWSARKDVTPDLPIEPAEEAFGFPVGWDIEDVTYQYPEADTPVVSGLSFSVAPGAACVITGESGVGKSTLVNLLLGLAQPNAGAVRLVGADGWNCDIGGERARLLCSLGYVGPESYLVPGTIRDNLNYGARREYNDEEIERALRKAECTFVYGLPMKLEHWLTEQGEGLSAGQKQRLELARALLREPDVLILDEATANLDAATETALIRTLSELKGRMTIIAVTHREAMLAIADTHLILSRGRAELQNTRMHANR